MRTRTKALAGGVAVLVIAAAATVVLRAEERDAPLAELEVARQSVEVERASAGDAADEDASGLAVGDRVSTDDLGLGTVNWFDGSLTRLGGNADFVVEELASAGGGRQIVGQLNFGDSWHRVQEATGSGSRFEVRTSDAIASVRGTTFLVRCTPNCRYGVAEGRVLVVTDGGESATLEGGQQVDVDENGKLGQVQPLDLDDPWLKLNQELDSQLDDDVGSDDEVETGAESEDGGGGNASTTSPPTTAATAMTSPPTSAAPFTARSRAGSDSGDERSAPLPPTTSTGTIPADPQPPLPPPPPPSPPASPTTAPSTSTAPTSTPATSTPTTSPPTTSDPPPTAPQRTTSSTSPSTTAPTTSTTAAPTTTAPPTTAPPTTSPPNPPSGGGGGPVPSPPATDAPPETGAISGTVSEPSDSSTDETTEVTARALSLVTAGTAVACPHGATGDITCFGEAIVDGAFTISDVPAGKYDVFAVPPEGRPDLAVSDPAIVDLAAGQHEEGVALIYNVAETEFELSGTVNEEGIEGPTPSESANVWVYPDPCVECVHLHALTTDSTGLFSVVLPPGDYLVNAWKEGFQSQTVPVTIVDAPTIQNFELAFAEPIFCICSGGLTPAPETTHTTMMLAADIPRAAVHARAKRESFAP